MSGGRFARFAMWFADWQGSPPFVALLTLLLAVWMGANLLLLHWGWAWDRPPFIGLNLGLSMLAAYAASLSVLGNKVQQTHIQRMLIDLEHALDEIHAAVTLLQAQDVTQADMLRALLALMEAHAPVHPADTSDR